MRVSWGLIGSGKCEADGRMWCRLLLLLLLLLVPNLKIFGKTEYNWKVFEPTYQKRGCKVEKKVLFSATSANGGGSGPRPNLIMVASNLHWFLLHPQSAHFAHFLSSYHSRSAWLKSRVRSYTFDQYNYIMVQPAILSSHLHWSSYQRSLLLCL